MKRKAIGFFMVLIMVAVLAVPVVAQTNIPIRDVATEDTAINIPFTLEDGVATFRFWTGIELFTINNITQVSRAYREYVITEFDLEYCEWVWDNFNYGDLSEGDIVHHRVLLMFATAPTTITTLSGLSQTTLPGSWVYSINPPSENMLFAARRVGNYRLLDVTTGERTVYAYGGVRTAEGSTYVLDVGYYYIASNWGGVIIIVTNDEEGTPPQPPTPPATVPNLTTASSWARESLTRAFDLGLIPTALQSAYTQATTRAEFAALGVALYETVTGNEITGRATFTDTTDVNVEKLAYLGVIDGVGGGRFAPNNQLTRQQAAVLVARLAEALGHSFEEAAPTFADNASIAPWARAGVGQAQVAGIMGGVGNNMFAPQGSYTREQSIITMLRLFDMVG